MEPAPLEYAWVKLGNPPKPRPDAEDTQAWVEPDRNLSVIRSRDGGLAHLSICGGGRAPMPWEVKAAANTLWNIPFERTAILPDASRTDTLHLWEINPEITTKWPPRDAARLRPPI